MYLFILIYFWLCWVFVATHGLALAVASRGYYLVVVLGISHCGDFCLRAWALGYAGFSSCGSRALEHGLSSCDAWA